MTFKNLPIALAMCVFAALTLSCSGSIPTEPPQSPDSIIENNPSDLTPVVNTADVESGHYLWMFHEIYVNEDHTDFEIATLREVTGHWNVLKFLEQGPCYNCFKIAGIHPTGPNVMEIDILIKHPFDLPNLTGFDVRGIAMFNGTKIYPISGVRTSDSMLGEGELLNADGYTALYGAWTTGSGPGGFQGYLKGNFATSEPPDSYMNGYKRHVSPGAANTRNAFFAGDEVTVTYEVFMPTGAFVFGYAVDASWAPPTTIPPDDPMNDFPPEANCPEPWKIDYSVEPIGPGLTVSGGMVDLIIDVYDYGGDSTNSMPFIEVPELADHPFMPEPVQDFGDYFRYGAVIENELLAELGMYKCLVTVEDEENDTSPEWLNLKSYQLVPLEVGPADPGEGPVAVGYPSEGPYIICEPVTFNGEESYDPDGGEIVTYQWDWECDGTYDEWGAIVEHTWDEVGVYMVQLRVTDDEGWVDTLDEPIEIQTEDLPPVALIEADKTEAYPDEEIVFSAYESHDQDCDGSEITEVNWDFDGDEVFDDAFGMEVIHSWSAPGMFYVKAQVVDNEGSTDVSDTLDILIIPYEPPVALAECGPNPVPAGLPVHFDGSLSYDPDGGDITLYEWDFGNDGTYDETGVEADHAWQEPGTYEVQLRVTDDEMETDTLDAALSVQVNPGLPDLLEEVTPEFLNFSPVDVVAVGDFLYVAGGPTGFHIFDLTTADNPVWRSHIQLPGLTVSVFYFDNKVYATGKNDFGATAYSALHIIDVSDSYSPSILKTVDMAGGSAEDVFVQGTYAYVANGSTGLKVVNITDPASAYVEKTVATSSGATDVSVGSGYAYVAMGLGVDIIDIDPLSSASVINSVYVSSYDLYSLDFYGEYVYAVVYEYSPSIHLELAIIDVVPPMSASTVKTVSLDDVPNDIEYKGDYVYITDRSGLAIYDVEPVSGTSKVTNIDISGDCQGISVSGDYAYVANRWAGIDVVDINPPGSAYHVWTELCPTAIEDVEVADGFAHMAGAYGYEVWDIDPLDSPVCAYAEAFENDRLFNIVIEDNTAYVVGWAYLYIYDITTPYAPALLKSVPHTNDDLVDVAIDNGYAYLTGMMDGMHVVDIDPLGSAAIVQTVPCSSSMFGIAVSGDYAYPCDTTSGIQVVDISDPEIAFTAHTVNTSGSAYDIVINGNYAYVADDTSGLQVIDITTPTSASVLNTVDTPGNAVGIFNYFDYSYIADTRSLELVDTSHPGSETHYDSVTLPGNIVNVMCVNGYAYVAARDGGFRVVDLW